MTNLTARQQEILRFIQGFAQKQSYWPSIREIQEYFKFKSTNAVVGHLRALEQKGVISRVQGQARAYRIPGKGASASGRIIEVAEIPVYGSITAGYPDGVEQGDAIGRLQIDVETAGIGSRNNRRTFALKVRGDSMTGAGIFEGDTVIMESRSPKNGDIVAALIDGETTLKRFIHPSPGAPYLKAENPAFAEIHPLSELIIQGVATAVVRKL
ncbi:MAG: transcriptional repressor LexA [Opitutales bacterium]